MGLVLEPALGQCFLNLRQFSLERDATRVDFSTLTREGTVYEAETDGACPKRPDLEANWSSWQTTQCLSYRVIHTEFAEAL